MHNCSSPPKTRHNQKSPQKKVLTQDFKNRTNLTDEEIEEQVEAIVLAGKDKDKAKKAKWELS